jgi:ferredoxin
MPELRIDFIACEGAGICAELLPELISQDEWGYPVVTNARVPDRLRRHARQAVTLCPKLALRLNR